MNGSVYKGYVPSGERCQCPSGLITLQGGHCADHRGTHSPPGQYTHSTPGQHFHPDAEAKVYYRDRRCQRDALVKDERKAEGNEIRSEGYALVEDGKGPEFSFLLLIHVSAIVLNEANKQRGSFPCVELTGPTQRRKLLLSRRESVSAVVAQYRTAPACTIMKLKVAGRRYF